MLKNNKIGKIIRTLILACGGIVMIMPVLWMVSASFKYENQVFRFPIEWIPKTPTIKNYLRALTEFPFATWYFNTARNTILIVCSTLLVSSMAGYAFAKVNFKYKNFIFMAYISALMIPNEVRIIPQFILYRNIGLINTFWSVVLPWMLFTAFSIFFMRQAFMGVPDELCEAAKIDGCNAFGIYAKICLPMIKNTAVSLTILSFTWGWNDYLGPKIYLSDVKQQVLSVGIASFRSQFTNDYAMQMAGASLALIPVVVVYLVGQKYFIEGITAGAVKG